MLGLFSKRNKKQEGVQPLVYDCLPKSFRAQVIHILMDTVPREPIPRSEYLLPDGMLVYGGWRGINSPVTQFWPEVYRVLIKEFGVYQLSDSIQEPFAQVLSLIEAGEVEKCLDAIEILFRFVDKLVREHPIENARSSPTEAINELNQRFKEHNLGYAFEKQLFRKDSDFVHESITAPALVLLRRKGFEGAEEEFANAHRHFRNGNYRETIVFANSAFESAMKSVLTKSKVKFDQNAPAKRLISTLIEEKLLPHYLETYFHELQKLLETGVPVIRNKAGGHGQGEKIQVVPESLAQYALNLAAANILMVVQNSKVK